MASDTIEMIKKKSVINHKASILEDIEFFTANKFLFIGVALAMICLGWVSYIHFNSYQLLPGMTESNPFNINFQEPVIVEKILVQSGQLINEGDPLFVLKRPDIQMRHYENKSLLKQAVVELNILHDTNRSVKGWEEYLTGRQDKGDFIGATEMKFLALLETDSFLMQEKKKLKVLSPATGYAGEILINVGETVAPFTTLISVYHPKASIVKSFIPETFDVAVINNNRSSVIRSMSRDYQINGNVVSIGPRLTELPTRFQKDPLNVLYGREIKIALPEGNNFFLGEKVFVSLEGS